jgi:glucose-6-phosphate 1-epimerase
MQQHGFARNMDWEICGTVRGHVRGCRRPRALRRARAQGFTPDEREPFVRLRLRDTPYSRAMWDHAFELEYQVTLGARNLELSLTARNTGKAAFAFTTALHSYIGVQNVREANVMLLVRRGTAAGSTARRKVAHQRMQHAALCRVCKA